MKTKIVYTRRIAYELRKLGFKILRTEPDKRNPYYDNYIFKWTPSIDATIESLK